MGKSSFWDGVDYNSAQEASQKMQKYKNVAFEVEALEKTEKLTFTREESLEKLLYRMLEYL